MKRRDPRFNITDTDQKYCIRLVVIKNLNTGQYYGENYPYWYYMPNPEIKVYKNKDASKSDAQMLRVSGINIGIEEMNLVPGLHFDR
jgi:hypothetical protein